jgi:hypothetical protein
VIRIGADIGLRCLDCGHRIMLARSELELRLTRFLKHAESAEPPANLDRPPPAAD